MSIPSLITRLENIKSALELHFECFLSNLQNLQTELHTLALLSESPTQNYLATKVHARITTLPLFNVNQTQILARDAEKCTDMNITHGFNHKTVARAVFRIAEQYMMK
jgi:hypothetical protein